MSAVDQIIRARNIARSVRQTLLWIADGGVPAVTGNIADQIAEGAHHDGLGDLSDSERDMISDWIAKNAGDAASSTITAGRSAPDDVRSSLSRAAENVHVLLEQMAVHASRRVRQRTQ